MRRKPDDSERLQHMIDAIDRIHEFSSNMSFDEFLSNEMAQFAIIKNFEIIGEAAYHTSQETKTRYPEIEWRKIEGLRHKLVHDYYEINLEIIWRTRDEKINQLKAQILDMLKD